MEENISVNYWLGLPIIQSQALAQREHQPNLINHKSAGTKLNLILI